MSFFNLVQSCLYLHKLREEENLAEIKDLQNMDANISRMSQCSQMEELKKLLSLWLNLGNLEMLFGLITSWKLGACLKLCQFRLIFPDGSGGLPGNSLLSVHFILSVRAAVAARNSPDGAMCHR